MTDLNAAVSLETLLNPHPTWQEQLSEIRDDLIFTELDIYTVCDRGGRGISCLDFLPTYEQKSTGQRFVWLESNWVPADSAPGFKRFQKIVFRAYDTALAERIKL